MTSALWEAAPRSERMERESTVSVVRVDPPSTAVTRPDRRWRVRTDEGTEPPTDVDTAYAHAATVAAGGSRAYLDRETEGGDWVAVTTRPPILVGDDLVPARLATPLPVTSKGAARTYSVTPAGYDVIRGAAPLPQPNPL